MKKKTSYTYITYQYDAHNIFEISKAAGLVFNSRIYYFSQLLEEHKIYRQQANECR